jgi:peptidoglycan/LPS O-acetylase OafA/YrhL
MLFAVAVLFSHAFEITDGNRGREILSRLTNPQFSFGTLGVDGFFLLSGYLIVKSWVGRPEIGDFMKKRFLRIAPGYAVATLFSAIVIGLIAPATGHFFEHLNFRFLRSLLFVYSPVALPVFPGIPNARLNASLWTIIYEFRCYVLVALCGLIGVFKRPKVWLALTMISMSFQAVFSLQELLVKRLPWPAMASQLLGDPLSLNRLVTIFLLGGCFFLFKDKITFSPLLAWCSVCGIIAVRILKPEHIEVGFFVFGGFLLFYFGSKPLRALAWMAKVPDLSYGIYLYGWPVETYLIWRFHPSPWIVFVLSTIICAGCAWLSWTFVERPALSLKKKKVEIEHQKQLVEMLA